MKKYRKYNGKRFIRKKCGALATIKASAKRIRARGGTARVEKKSGGGACLYEGPKAKRSAVSGKKKKTRRKSTRRRKR